MTCYTVDKILSIINSYHINVNNVREISREMASVGVSQYGVESSLPKSNAISNVVEKEAMRQMEMSTFFADMITDMKYLQDRWDRVTEETEAQILAMRLSGYSATDISMRLKMSRKNVYLKLRNISRTIGGYPQSNYTNYTD